MNSRKQNSFIVALGVSVVFLILGILILLTACHGECGSDVHGGMLTWVCPRVYCPKAISVTMTAVGAIGMIISSALFIICSKSKQK